MSDLNQTFGDGIDARTAATRLSNSEYRRRFQKLDFFAPHAAQQRAFADTAIFQNLQAGNRSGKTTYALVETALATLGRDAAFARAFHYVQSDISRPVAFKCWVIAPTSVVVRDIHQVQLLGGTTPDLYGTGWLPKSALKHPPLMSRGIAGLVDTVTITRDDGTLASISFKTHEMDVSAFQGDAVDLIILDEDPGRKGEELWPELLARIVGTGGRIIHTATPRAGLSPIRKFFRAPGHPERSTVRMAIYDNTYLRPEDIATFEASLTDRERQTRLYGDEMPGFGQVFNFAEETYLHDRRPEDMPTYFTWINGMDFSHFGLSSQAHPWAFVSCCIDPASGIVYVMHAIRIKQQLGPVHVAAAKTWGCWDAPTAYGADGAQRTSDGQSFASVYKNLGMAMRPGHATMKDGSVSLEATISDMETMFAKGQLKIARHLTELRQEIRDYAYDENNKVIAMDDDLVSALRYAITDRRFAKIVGQFPRNVNKHRGGQVRIADGADHSHFGCD